MIWLARYWKPLAALALGALLYGWGYTTARTAGLYALQMERTKAEKALTEMARAESEAKSKAWAKERQMAEYVSQLARKHEQELRDAQAREDRRVADLRDGNLRLRREVGALYTERLSRPAAAAGELSADAQRGAEIVGAAVGVGADCDAQVKGLQDAYEATRR